MATVAIAGLVVTIIAAAAASYAQYEQGQQQQAAARYNRKVAENQAKVAQDAAAAQERAQRERNRRLLAMQRQQVGAAGLDTSGSPLTVMLDSAEEAEIESLRIRYGGDVAAAGNRADATLQTFYGQQAAQAGTISAGTTLLSGASSAAGQYSRYKTRYPDSTGAP